MPRNSPILTLNTSFSRKQTPSTVSTDLTHYICPKIHV
ncbi:hypothetical protein TOT_020000826 [Theileria orientalis strain Shintoku]|uniref:Uncharacterized protein n=1 Tax=Theileria orientalis strain Shintoku TaxID=869250 RepID=J4C3J9_THEOR|nr:hypothetical protein TOT_020000826 [Theileria orientalis strain Shintoku]PVC51712.1 hypothetical protein MACL_00001341 [Theileria orientalis]BAM40571.1 hypothetical protein TOT_020000826 [Theileria orientalis strain Shintoku]|eukprot:XP_009690872.1 hypothetical protein TOT_020000826 [Theileria orientalis strain Shintoku]